ncbi:S9 family peptidase [Flavobacterium granuli]|uniref:Dipeptidyl aminopeptidase/acylaminoacyl peptidase n=1 Tax=Flavobacterium granuli TaxID=280093 RepID=A0A1M5NHT3_9FLAO|nr:prolyl oligopeptidase family serine peptidase [Flavobacterium granuli]PRZ23288.1 dipeptidyl aminopeptidase/acylaminoacyl peptidase [Flavobacterium granuli]SHG89136.1 Dipeptidyl aminopeptidase/acylaminoacyl peptidase [Flavobacterium granuli]
MMGINYNTKFKQLVWVSVFFLVQHAFAQDKKTLTASDYERWYHLYQYTLSSDEKWVNYSMHHPKGKDTLVLHNVDTASKQIIVGGTQGSFAPKSDWFVFLRNQQLCYQQLKTGIHDSIEGVDSFLFSKGGAYLIGERKKERELTLFHLASKKLQVISSVETYILSPDSTQLALVLHKDGQRILSIFPFTRSKVVYEVASFSENISGLTWNYKGNGVAFFETVPPSESSDTAHRVHYLQFKTKQLPKVDQLNSEQVTDGYELPFSRLFFSRDDEQLFFDVKQIRKPLDTKKGSAVVWSYGAKVLPSSAESGLVHPYLMCWHLKTNRSILMNKEAHSITVPTTTGKHALMVEKSPYLPHFEHNGIYADLYVLDLQTGRKKLIVKKISHQKNHIIVSPHGKYITWFTNNNWWLYDIATDKKRCLTCSISSNFENMEHDYPGDQYPNDKPYWSTNDQYLLLSDYYDLWMFSADGKISKRLTEGHLSKSKYRLFDQQLTKNARAYFLLYTTRTYPFEKGLIFKDVNTYTLEEGFSFYQQDKAVKRIFYSADRINSISKKNSTYLFVLSDFDKSAELMIQHANQNKADVIQSTNELQKEYHWGKSELIHYTINGVPLKGALFYPANYQSETTYPMIVNIYERNSSLLRKYVAPSLHNYIGFNVTNYTTAGYFVLMPDIAYTVNKPGQSALECVLAAVDKTLATVSVDKDNIGLFGHSFGGFEVSYIAAKTQRFKTIVSGSGWHDLVGTYLGTDDSNSSNIWRFDTQQLRITEPYFTKTFWDNSPVMHAYQINTPLLLWSGTNDLRVNWKNSVSMQLALWRLKKESTLLLYDKEGHVLEDPSNQKDLTLKIMEWFDYYLKASIKPKWCD